MQNADTDICDGVLVVRQHHHFQLREFSEQETANAWRGLDVRRGEKHDFWLTFLHGHEQRNEVRWRIHDVDPGVIERVLEYVAQQRRIDTEYGSHGGTGL